MSPVEIKQNILKYKIEYMSIQITEFARVDISHRMFRYTNPDCC